MSRYYHDISDSWVQHAIKLVRSDVYRQKQKSLIVSGHKIVSELKGLPVFSTAVSMKYFEKFQIPNDSYVENPKFLTNDAIKAITREANPEGIIAEIKLPQLCKEDIVKFGERILVLYKISDPRNMGALIRTASALLWDRIILIKGSVDPFNLESVRSSKGHCLRAKIHLLSLTEFQDFVIKNNIVTWLADCILKESCSILRENFFISAKSQYLFENLPRTMALILGSESIGFSGFPESFYNSANLISIKTSEEVDSLNVAVSGGILMNHFTKIKKT